MELMNTSGVLRRVYGVAAALIEVPGLRAPEHHGR
jgi:hypothetical protein